MAHDFGVEGIAGKADAFVAEELTFGAADAQQRKVTGAAAEVADDDELFMVERAFVMVGGGDGLEFKVDLLEAGFGEGNA